MSYILEALRRAERERSGTPHTPQIVQQGGAPHIAQHRPVWPFVLLGFALALGLTGLVLTLVRDAPALPAAEIPVAAIANANPSPAAEAAPAEEIQAHSLDELLDDSLPPMETAAAMPEEETVISSAAEEIPSEPAAAPPMAAEQAASTSVETIELEPAPEPAIPALKDMPPEYRADFPKLKVDVHAYDDDSAGRFCMINGRRYHEGDTLTEGPRITEITSDGIVFNFRGSDVLVPVGY